jgi:hypothetical protein
VTWGSVVFRFFFLLGDLLLQNHRERLPHKLAALRHGESLGQANDMIVRRVVRDGFHVIKIRSGLLEKKLFGDVVGVGIGIDVGIGGFVSMTGS